MKKILRKIIGGAGKVIWICAAAVIIVTVFCLVFHIRPAVIVSGSMEPAIHTGSMVFVDTEYDAEKVVERDIIAFDMNGTMVTHRVKETLDNGFITKGDANDSQDPAPVSVDNYMGRVIMWIPWIGYATAFLSGTKVKILVIAAFVSVMLIYSLTGKEEVYGTKQDTDSADNSAA